MPSEDGFAQLTDAKREQLEAFLAQRRADAKELNNRYAVMSASSWLTTLARSLKEGQQLQPEQAEAIWQDMGEVAKSLRRAGCAKPRATRRAKPASTPPAPSQEAATGEPSAPDAKHVRKPRTAKVKTSATSESGQSEQGRAAPMRKLRPSTLLLTPDFAQRHYRAWVQGNLRQL